jgi:formate dehydrogenase assembly factor FdhD
VNHFNNYKRVAGKIIRYLGEKNILHNCNPSDKAAWKAWQTSVKESERKVEITRNCSMGRKRRRFEAGRKTPPAKEQTFGHLHIWKLLPQMQKKNPNLYVSTSPTGHE